MGKDSSLVLVTLKLRYTPIPSKTIAIRTKIIGGRLNVIRITFHKILKLCDVKR